jgi:hypothetical protein
MQIPDVRYWMGDTAACYRPAARGDCELEHHGSVIDGSNNKPGSNLVAPGTVSGPLLSSSTNYPASTGAAMKGCIDPES